MFLYTFTLSFCVAVALVCADDDYGFTFMLMTIMLTMADHGRRLGLSICKVLFTG